VVKQMAVRRVGGSVSITLPKDIAERLRIGPGDKVFLVETESGVLLTPFDPSFEQAMKIYERGATRYRNALHELAK
jgi:putative addiction module antidote